MMKILNLYAGLGGNRLPWNNCTVVAIEHDPVIAGIYKQRFPDDEIMICDASSYLEQYFQDFDYIWASPPCPSHSRMALVHSGKRYKGWNMKVEIPDFKLYGIIIFLQHHFRGDWTVENVKPFYAQFLDQRADHEWKEMITPTAAVGRHLIWSNKNIATMDLDLPPIMYKFDGKHVEYYKQLCKELQVPFNLIEPHIPTSWNYEGDKIGQILRNTIHPVHAKYIWEEMTRKKRQQMLLKYF